MKGGIAGNIWKPTVQLRPYFAAFSAQQLAFAVDVMDLHLPVILHQISDWIDQSHRSMLVRDSTRNKLISTCWIHLQLDQIEPHSLATQATSRSRPPKVHYLQSTKRNANFEGLVISKSLYTNKPVCEVLDLSPKHLYAVLIEISPEVQCIQAIDFMSWDFRKFGPLSTCSLHKESQLSE